MSTLVEAVSVVIPRHVLDVSYPGGCDAYLEGARRTRGVRFVVADARLTCVSLPTLDDATAFVRPLEAIGLTTPDGRPLAIACVDEHFGPTAPAPWLRWRRHEEGFTSCWLEWTEPGELVLPDTRLDGDGPAAEASPDETARAMAGPGPDPFAPDAPDVMEPIAPGHQMEPTEPRHEPERALDADPEPDEEPFLSGLIPATMEESPVTTVLDMTPTPTDAPAVTLLDAVRAGLDRQGWRHGVDAAQGAAFFQASGSRASYAGSAFVDDAEGLARVYTHIPVRIPEHRRAAAVELLTRVNRGLPVGNFEFDYGSGEVCFKATTDCGPHMTSAAVDRLLRLGVTACDRVHDPMMQVIYGGVEAEMVVGEGR